MDRAINLAYGSIEAGRVSAVAVHCLCGFCFIPLYRLGHNWELYPMGMVWCYRGVQRAGTKVMADIQQTLDIT